MAGTSTLRRRNESAHADEETLFHALSRSRNMLVICSESSRQSTWMAKELEWFLRERPKNILVAVTEGVDPSHKPSEVFSSQLIDAKLHKQFWYDFRGARRKTRLAAKKLRDFHEERTRLAADLLEVSIDDARPIWLEAQRRRTRRRLLTSLSLTALTMLLAGVTILSVREAMLQNQYDQLRVTRQRIGRSLNTFGHRQWYEVNDIDTFSDELGVDASLLRRHVSSFRVDHGGGRIEMIRGIHLPSLLHRLDDKMAKLQERMFVVGTQFQESANPPVENPSGRRLRPSPD